MSSSAKRRRQQSYDMDNPANWTINKLKTELETRGIKLTASVSKAALLQLYNQLSKPDIDIHTEVSSEQTFQDQMNTAREVSQDQLTLTNNPSANVVPVRNIPATVTSAVPSPVTADTSYNAGPSVTPINQAGAITSSTINDSATVTSTAVTHNSVAMTPEQSSISSLDNSSLGMITAMQSTICSLQSTVNQLLTEKSTKIGQSTPNMLEKYYGKETLQTPATTTASQFGVAADSLPHVDVISETLKRNILEGKFINLACLLIPDFEPPNLTTNEASGLEFLRQGRRDHRLDRSLSITQFF